MINFENFGSNLLNVSVNKENIDIINTYKKIRKYTRKKVMSDVLCSLNILISEIMYLGFKNKLEENKDANENEFFDENFETFKKMTFDIYKTFFYKK